MSYIPVENLPVYFLKVLITPSNGQMQYATVQANPSAITINSPEKQFRMWNFNMTVELYPQPTGNYEFVIDGTKIEPKPVKISFDGPLTGMIVFQNKVLNANQYIKYRWSEDDPYRIFISMQLPCRIQKNTIVNMNININDCDCFTNCDCISPGF